MRTTKKHCDDLTSPPPTNAPYLVCPDIQQALEAYRPFALSLSRSKMLTLGRLSSSYLDSTIEYLVAPARISYTLPAHLLVS